MIIIAGSMTHDLRTPLQAFTFELDNLQNECQTLNVPSKLPEFKAMLRENVSQLNLIVSFMTMAINRSLDYTKVSTGVALVPSISQVDITETTSWILSSLTHKVRKSVDIVMEPLEDNVSPVVLTDKQWFMENIFCYLSNALKFTFDGQITVRCIVPDRCGDASKMLVEVEDSGIGLTNSQKRELFRPFKQAQSRAGGTGLGLFSLRKRVTCLGGDCGVRDRADGQDGSVFWFSVPYVPDTCLGDKADVTDVYLLGSHDDIKTADNGGDTCRSGSVQRRILVVDDSVLIQKATKRSLEREGYIVDVAANGYECLKMINFAVKKYDLILLDLNMPIMDGLETVSRLREQERKNRFGYDSEDSSDADCQCPNGNTVVQANIVVGFSGNSDEGTKTEALEAGMDAFLSKPLRPDDLRALGSYIKTECV